MKEKAIRLALFGVVSFVVLMAAALALHWGEMRPKLAVMNILQDSVKPNLVHRSKDGAPGILIVGSTMTARYMIPWAVACFAKSKKGATPEICQLLVQEANLEYHFDKGELQKRLNDENWDFVILQEQIGRSVQEFDEMKESTRRIADLAVKDGARVLLLESVAGKGLINTQKKVSENYRRLSRDLELEVIPAGDCIMAFEELDTDIEMFEPNLQRPSMQGAYLIACLLFETIYGESCIGAPNVILYRTWVGDSPTMSLSPQQAKLIQEFASNYRKEWHGD